MILRTAATILHRRSQQINTLHSFKLNPTNESRASLVTSAQKRALNKDQISGSSTSTSASASSAVPPNNTVVASASSGNTTSTVSSSSPKPVSNIGGGSGGSSNNGPPKNSSSSSFLPTVGLVAAAVGGAYYMGYIPNNLMDKKSPPPKEPVTAAIPAAVSSAVVSTPDKVVEQKQKIIQKDQEKEKETPREETKPTKKVTSTKTADDDVHKVIQIQVPPTNISKKQRHTTPPPEVQHVPNGNRVSMSPPPPVSSTKLSTPPSTPTSTNTTTTTKLGSVADEASNELKALSFTTKDTTTTTTQPVETTTSSSLVDLSSLENMNENQLRIRVVQLMSDMSERAKWEAVRLKEFLAMKEKEVGEKYLDLLQKQRHEFEDLLARRLREQEDTLTKQTQAALEAKDKSIQTVIEAATSAQKAEYEAALSNAQERIEQECNAKFEVEYATKLSEEKTAFVKELEEKLKVIQELTSRIGNHEQLLQISKNFETDSQRAHRISAAALSLANKMESSKGAAEELAALKAAAMENSVIASALTNVPSSVREGIPTLSELQSSFQSIHQLSREAAHVPKGRSGLEGQFAGMLFAKLTVQPSPDAPPPQSMDGETPPSSDSKMADYILARAKKYVQLGQLQDAVGELDKLKGQVAFTVQDWKNNAMDRIAVDQALKVIKMECAIMNKSMSG